MDLGHPLKFGLATGSSLENSSIALAQSAQELGLDTVSITGPASEESLKAAEPWTEAAWLAGKTSTLTINATGLNPRVHVPAMTAHSAATLDILSGGRASLTLDFDSEHQGRETSGETEQEQLDFIRESTTIIRAMWDTSKTQGVTFTGDFHHLAGAQAGPAPLENIVLWFNTDNLGAVGELADGWVRPLPGILAQGSDLSKLAEQQRVIDTAAIAAGRDPREILRKVQLDRSFLLGQDPAGFLIQLVDLGFAEFELVTSELQDLTIFAMEIVPLVTSRVLQSRFDAGIMTGIIKPISVRSQRSPAIDYAAIPVELQSRMVEPGETKYGAVKSTYMRGGSPALVLQPRTWQEVSQALLFAQTQRVELGIRSGGHGISGRSTNRGGIIIDVGAMNQIQILDKDNHIVRVGPGARWGQIAKALTPYGWAISSGDFGGVGVGGLATAGGVGFFGRKHGLTIDHMVAAEMVMADGSHVRVSKSENPDLFWAIRGAGQNFGIATAFEFRAAEVGDIGYAQLALQVDDLAEFLVAYGKAVEEAPRELTPFLLMGQPRAGAPAVVQIMAVVASDDPQEIVAALQPFANLGALVGQQVALTSYAQVVDSPDSGPSRAMGEPVSRSAAVNHITPAFAQELAAFIMRGESYFFQIRSVGGAVSDVPVYETAYAHRAANFQLSALAPSQPRLNAAWEKMAEYFDGMYMSFDTDRRPERVKDAFPPITLAKLQGLKRQYDPNNVFKDNLNIPA